MTNVSLEQFKLIDQIDICIDEINLLKEVYDDTLAKKSVTEKDFVTIIALNKSIFTDIGTLFDLDRRSVSLFQLFGNLVIEKWIKKFKIKGVLDRRNKQVAHIDRKELEGRKLTPMLIRDIIELKEFLLFLKKEINQLKS
ncbi:MAG: hypothetical protein ACOYUK_02970 [Patescibacteria group bacterium]